MHDALIGELTRLIIKNDMAEQLLREHRRTDFGTCTCSTPNVCREFPCVTHFAASRAFDLVLASRPRLVRAG